MTKKEIEEEILYLKKELALLEGHRLITVPKGTRNIAPGTAGRCIVCGQHNPARDNIRRCCKTTASGAITGLRVCYRCSPKIDDVMLARYSLNIDEWSSQWFDRDRDSYGERHIERGSRIEELETYYDDEELAQLDRMIKRMEALLAKS